MNMMIRSKIIKIGNSRGIRIPRAVLEQVGLTDEVEMKVEGDRLIIHSVRHIRQGWENHFAEMAEKGDDLWLDQTATTHWGEAEWTW